MCEVNNKMKWVNYSSLVTEGSLNDSQVMKDS